MNDTDSIITDCNISKYEDLMKNYMWDGCGDEPGSQSPAIATACLRSSQTARRTSEVYCRST